MSDTIKNNFKKIKAEQMRIREEVRKKTIGYIVAALGLVAGLAWNDAIKTIKAGRKKNREAGIKIKIKIDFLKLPETTGNFIYRSYPQCAGLTRFVDGNKMQ